MHKATSFLRFFLRLLTFSLIWSTVFSSQSAAKTPEEDAAKDKNPPTATATFAGGCFWCMEPPFDKIAGVISTTSGYTGGSLANPTYEQVSAGNTGHYEAVQVLYDPARTSYEKLLDVFWKNIDPLNTEGQFCDRGKSYRTAIFYHDENQKALAEETKKELTVGRKFGKPIATQILPAGPFYRAEEYHQDYYKKNPVRYRQYRNACERDSRLEELWGLGQ